MDSDQPLRHKKDMSSEPVIQLQFQQAGDLGTIYTETYFDIDTETISLSLGKEYFIDVVPTGSRASDSLKSLDAFDRKCLLKDELPESSVFKQYSESNCKYECRVELVSTLCGCVPWDFITTKLSPKKECDVFGRTCFFAKMKNVTRSPENICPQCQKACDYTNYKTIKIREQNLHHAL